MTEVDEDGLSEWFCKECVPEARPLDKDEQKLEEITAAFTKAIILNRFDDLNRYKELSKRLAELISAAVKFENDQALKRVQMGVSNSFAQTN
jgi:hypothetical protein